MCIRDRLGDGYTLDDLLAVLSGQKEHTPRKLTAVQAAPPKVNLLVDIQDKLKAGKGAGYARWAKVFNLKQMALTLNYLSEHGLDVYKRQVCGQYHANLAGRRGRQADTAGLLRHLYAPGPACQKGSEGAGQPNAARIGGRGAAARAGTGLYGV